MVQVDLEVLLYLALVYLQDDLWALLLNSDPQHTLHLVLASSLIVSLLYLCTLMDCFVDAYYIGLRRYEIITMQKIAPQLI